MYKMNYFYRAVAAVRHRVVLVVALPLEQLVRRHHRRAVRGRHLHLPHRVLRVHAAPIVAVRVTVLHVRPCEEIVI